jgi:photosystem II stability/assembly factor-like uncharacterized protein
MKKIIKKFWGVAFAVVLISSLFAGSSSGLANGVLTPCFPYAPLPTATAGSPIGITAIGTTVFDYAVAQTDQNVIWAATSDNALMSTDQGRTWTKMFIGTQAGDNPTQLVCIAPDDKDVVVYVTNQYPTPDAARTVLITINGGYNWFDLGTPESLAGVDVVRIYDIDISEEFTDLYGFTYRYIGVAGTATAGAAAFYYIKFGAYAVSTWRDAVVDPTAPLTVGTQGYDNYYNNTAFVAVKFSPHFSIDNIAYLMSTNGTGVFMHVISLNIEHRFNTKISGYNIWGYNDQGIDMLITLTSGVAKAQLLFAADFNGVFYDPSYPRIAYWSVAGCTVDEGGYGSFYEDINGIPAAHKVTGSLASWSIALNGTTLVAGYAYHNMTPGGGLGLIMKRIGGGSAAFGGIDDPYAMLTVFYADDNLLCAGQGDQSAFSLSLDNGKTWNDISLVDTDMDWIDDFAVEESEGVQQYIVSHGWSQGDHQIPCFYGTDSKADSYTASVWYYDGTYWERVYIRATTYPQGPDVHRFQIKASPDNFAVAYLADTANATIYYTPDNGQLSWRQRSAPIVNTTLADIEVVDDANLYVATNVLGTGYVCPLTFSGQYWNASDYISVFGPGLQIFSITLVADDVVLAGSATGGKVAYTTTGGNTPPEWTIILGAIPGNNILTEALSLAGGSPVYATSTEAGYAEVWVNYVGSTSGWIPAHYSCLGSNSYSVDLFIYGTGIGQCLYYLAGDDSEGDAWVALERYFLDGSTGSVIDTYYPSWCILTCGCSDWPGRTPDALKGSYPLNTLWFTDRWGDTIWPNPMRGFGETVGRFEQIEKVDDTLAYFQYVITGPADGYVIQVNKQTGVAYDITLTFTSPYGYGLVMVSKDPTFTDIKAIDCVPSPVNIGPHVTPSTPTPVSIELPLNETYSRGFDGFGWGLYVDWQPGETYYIMVASCDDCFHPSAPISVTIMSTPLPIPELYAPACGGTVSSLTPGLTWSPMAGVSAYTVQIGTGPNLDNPLYLLGSWQVTGTTGYQVPVDYLLDGSTYYWRVAAGTAGPFMWSPTCSFTVELPAEPETVTTTSYVAPSTQTVPVPTNADQTTVTQTSQAYIWAIIVIGAVLVVAIIVLIFRVKPR